MGAATNQQIMETVARERKQAVAWLRDGLGCLPLNSPTAHELRGIADKIRMVADFPSKRWYIELEGYDLTHTVAGFEFGYRSEHQMCVRSQGNGDFPVCILHFKSRPVAIGKDTPVFRGDEHLMRAGIILKVQSDDTEVMIRNKPRDGQPALALEYSEMTGLSLTIGMLTLSDLTKRFVIGANLTTQRVFVGNLGLNWT